MSGPLQITKKLAVTPLVDIRNAECARGYASGLHWCLYGEREGTGPLEDSYLATNLEKDIKSRTFEPRREGFLYHSLGFYLGMLHGGVLDRRGQLRKDVTTLVMLSDPDITRGYHAGRESYFLDLGPQERDVTDALLVDGLREYVEEEGRPWENRKAWNFNIGCLLGEFSGRPFPWTREEHQAWEQECIRQLGYVCTLHPDCLAYSQFAMQRV